MTDYQDWKDNQDPDWRPAQPPTPDTSPGDELDDALYEFHDIDCMSGWPGKLDCNCKVKEAKDRLNRLMLTRMKAELKNVLASSSGGGSWRRVIHTRIAVIDAQLNKEEK